MNLPRQACMAFILASVASWAPASPAASALVERFQAETVFWQQADLADEIAPQLHREDLAPLEPWLKHDDRHIRGNVAYLFERVGDRRGFDTLVGIVVDRSSPRTINPPVIVIGDGDFEAWRRTPQAFAQQVLADRYYAVHLMGQLRDPRAVDVLIPLLDGDEIDYNAAWALGQIGDARAIRPLIKSLSSPDAGMRVAAIGALEALHATEALPQIITLFDDMAVPQAGQQVPVATTARKAAESIRRPATP
jgi:hypothetical protein